MSLPTLKARLVQKACLSECAQCYHLEFQLEDVPSFVFVPGQFVSMLAVDPFGKTQTRAYSLASASNGNCFDLCVNRVEGGFFSNYLCDMQPGSTVQVRGPHGHFTLRQPLTDSILVATGTGIAPMRAFTQWLFPERGEHAGRDRSESRQFWLIYGTRYESGLYYRDYFTRIAAEHDNFHYIPTLSRAGEEWIGHQGYVQEHVEAIVQGRSRGLTKRVAAFAGAWAGAVAAEESVAVDSLSFDIHAYLCGLNQMVSAVRERVANSGWHKNQIIFERYN